MKKVQILKRTYHLISRSKNGKKAEIVILSHLSNGKYASQTCHAISQDNGTLRIFPTLTLMIDLMSSEIISGKGALLKIG